MEYLYSGGTQLESRQSYRQSILRRFVGWVFLVPSGEHWDNTLTYAMTDFFHILSTQHYHSPLPFDAT
jgi:hypothetical protein